ncbi:MAG TPA: class I SAM-dependent methyltransferase [Thermoanaerobaculia bacterium]|nr:class I SAM-dependent methyltransferase [Thermoanaerobaculia bacterium]HUM28837.1 class I SAM-dependent methyltransferase [Thermoanaerobaculia bacterium]HXK67229.1 class I SAM-dependent methyltransferase [Thermoanaerobaculia bacterium]
MNHTPGSADPARLRNNYEIERELAGRLWKATGEQRKTLYGEVYKELFQKVELPGYVEAQREQVGLQIQLLQPFLNNTTRFLEIGAGSCYLSLALADRLTKVWAVDAVPPVLSEDMVPHNFRFVQSEQLHKEVATASVDLIFSCHFVEHLHPDDLPGHLSDVFELLIPGGQYIMVTPNRIYGPHDSSRGFSERASGLHLQEYTHGTFAVALRRTGFTKIRAIAELGKASSSFRLRWVAMVERIVDSIPASCRRVLLARVPRKAPFRPLEQVKLVAEKPRD